MPMMFRLVERLGITNLCDSAQVSFAIARTELSQHSKDRQPNHPRDYVDTYLDQMDSQSSENGW